MSIITVITVRNSNEKWDLHPIDIEPFHENHLPFYGKLRALLNAAGKIVTMLTGRTSGPIYGAADVIVFSGYDLGISPLTTANYATALESRVSQDLKSAKAAGASLMAGIPVSASWEEYVYQTGTCAHRVHLSADVETAKNVDQRRGKPIVLRV